MAKISTYVVDNSISADDIVIGSDAEDTNITKNYRLGDIATFIEAGIEFDCKMELFS